MPTSLWCKPKLFLASSTQARPTAQQLILKLADRVEICPWWTVCRPGESTLSALVDEVKRSDFAAVLLTADDLTIRGNQPAEANTPQRRTARDNCIFELGLFTGGLGLRPERTFILTSLRPEELPSDLQGITHIPVKELAESETPDENAKKEFNEALEAACARIEQAVETEGYCYDRAQQLKLIPKDHLMQMERPRPEGNIENDYGVNVIVHSDQPVEKNQESARVVQENMSNEVSYNYFFQADNDSLTQLPGLIRGLATVRLGIISETQSVDFWNRAMLKSEETQQQVIDSLANMKEHLRIYLLEHTEQVQFCIHNANRPAAICYLRYPPGYFVEWCTGDNAKQMAEKLWKKLGPDTHTHIFNGSRQFDLDAAELSKQQFKKQLWKGIEKLFPRDFQEQLRDVCFGNWSE